MHRTQLYLDDDIYERLTRLARKQKRTISELVREALVRTYGVSRRDELRTTLEAVFGLWKDRDDIGDTQDYVRKLRQDSRRRRLYLRRK